MINNSNFIIKEIPEFHPISQMHEKMEWWKDFKRKCIEGEWSSGKWCPGNLWFYINAWYIRIENKKGSKGKIIGRPWFRDLEWEKAWNLMEAKGFSGFSEDKEYTCNRYCGPEKESAIKFGFITEEEANSKIYIPAREYLRKTHSKALGKPLFENSAKNIVDLESRETGKSYSTAGMAIGHNFLFDGAIDYDEYLKAKKEEKYMTSETLVGAIDTKYSSDLISKVKLGLDNLPGEVEYQGMKYPSPIYNNYHGSLASGRFIETDKSTSKIYHRSFADDPLAAAGTRPTYVALEEVGFMSNIEEVLGGLEDCVAQDGTQTGVVHMFGTGGYSKGTAVVHMERIFRNPDDYNCLVFDDVYENKGTIGYFVPATKSMNKFKEGPNLITNHELSEEFFKEKRKGLKEKSSVKFISEVINRPLVPSEMFLTVEGNFFPTTELKEQLAKVEGNKEKYIDANWVGKFRFDETGNLHFEDKDLNVLRNYPLNKNDDKEGAVELYERPKRNSEGKIPFGKYIGGIDTFDKDKSSTDSLGSIFIMNRETGRIVAEYTGRPEQGSNIFYETCRRLLMFYNATGMYEKNLTGLYTYFKNKKSLFLLADTPMQFRDTDTYKEGTNTSKGINASERTNRTAREFIKNYLWEEIDENPDIINMQFIRSLGLLKELILWNPDGNFDRVSALGMLMWHDQTLYKEIDKKKASIKSIHQHEYWKKMGLTKKSSNEEYFATIKEERFLIGKGKAIEGQNKIPLFDGKK